MAESEVSNSPKQGEFYVISVNYDAPLHEVDLVNAAVLRPAGRAIIRPEAGGFPSLAEVPQLRESSADHTLNDFQRGFEGYWVISKGLKDVFQAVDPTAFEFVPCEFIRFDGSRGDAFYLCDVVRTLDAIDDEDSEVRIATEGYPAGKYYKLAGGARLAFKHNVVGGAHIFGSPFNGLVVCDRVLRDALVEKGYGVAENGSGMEFHDAAAYLID